MANHERNAKLLLELLKLPGNCWCADCGGPDPQWASYKLGIFVCLNCSGIHRSLTSRVKSIKLDFWEDELVEFMKSNGNVSASALFEKAVPVYYYRPQENDCRVLREQWIRAKYERKEFTGETKYPPISYTTGFYEGVLWKKGKENTQFLKRKFVLSEREFTLTYYNKENESKGPKAVISIKDLNATFQPEKIRHPQGLQLTYQDNNHTRNLYVYHESPEEIVTWFNAIRAARYAYLKTAYPTGSDEEVSVKISQNQINRQKIFQILMHFKMHSKYLKKTFPFSRVNSADTKDNKKLPQRGIHGKDGAIANGAVQKEVVCFGLSKQEAVVLQRPAGCRGVGGNFHRHREHGLLCEGVCPKAGSGKQMEVWRYGGNSPATVCLHVPAGEGAEGVVGRPQTSPLSAHGTAGLCHSIQHSV